MNVLLSHLGLEPLIYGIVIFFGLAVMWFKLATGRFVSFSIDVGVFALVFAMHGGTLAGGMAAAVAALLAGLIFPLFIRGRA
jgi:hypothetical protein